MKISNSEQGSTELVIIKIDLEEIFNGRQEHRHHQHHDPGTVVYYVISVDKKRFELREHELNGKQILGLVGLAPDKFRLFQIGEGHKEILPEEIVDFRTPGIERFKSVAKHANEGKEAAAQAASSTVRRNVELLAEDETILSKKYPLWETLLENNAGWIILKGFNLPSGYNIQETTLAMMIPTSYPTNQFDMMYFCPALSRQDGKAIGALSSQVLDGKSFQRWSRHRNANEWRPGVDNVETHILSVYGWLKDELKK